MVHRFCNLMVGKRFDLIWQQLTHPLLVWEENTKWKDECEIEARLKQFASLARDTLLC